MSESISAPGYLLEGKYQIVGVVGEGAWGIVLEGINLRIRRRVAIKILKAEYASRADMVSRFEREALASTHIESPHVVQVYDAGVLADGRPYLVMEFLTGDDLGTHLCLGDRLPLATVVDLCAQVARGLAAAHAAGVFHRDMKPSNIVIAKTKSGREIAKIVDFGISKLLDASKPVVSHTQTGTVLGSPVYMSPEQARGSKETDHRSDLYSLGVVLFECLTGRPPHDAEGFNALLFKIALEAAPRVRSLRPDIDEELDEIVARLLAKGPEQRVQSATELEGLLNTWLRKNGGVKLGETPTESGPRVLDGLTTSPLTTRAALSSGQLKRPRGLGLPNLEATFLPEDSSGGPPDSLASTRLADDVPASAGSPRIVHSPSVSAPELNDSSATRPEAEAARPGRRGYLLAGAAALLLIVGVAAVAMKSRPPTNGLVAGDPKAELPVPTASAASSASLTAAPDLSAAPAGASPSATTSSKASASPPYRDGLGTGVSRPVLAAGSSSAGQAKPVSSGAPGAPGTEAQPAASSAGSASVGGRTIRTEF